MSILEAGSSIEERGHTENSAQFKRRLEDLHKIHVAHLKSLSRNQEDYAKKRKKIEERYHDDFKALLEEAQSRQKEFLDYQRKFAQELEASYAKVDYEGNLVKPLENALLKNRQLRAKEMTAVIQNYNDQMKQAENYRAQYFNVLEAIEHQKKQVAYSTRPIERIAEQNVLDELEAQAQQIKESMESITETAKIEVEKRAAAYHEEAKAVAELNKSFIQVSEDSPFGDHLENLSTGFDMLTDKTSNFFSNLKGRNFKALGESLMGAGKLGQTLQGRATQEGTGGGAKLFGVIGKLLESFGPALRIFGALAKGFANVVSFIIDVDSAGKALNRSFLDAASGADLLVSSANDGMVTINNSLRDIRQGINDFGLQQQFGVTTEAAMGMIAEFQAAGVTLKEMQGAMTNASDSEEAYIETIKNMISQQKILGASVEDVASITEKYGFSLEDIATRFSEITSSAMESGFGVKRFYSMVLQATTGMGIYNTRIEEAAYFAVRLGKILGSRGLQESGLLQKLSQGFKGQGVKENYKSMMMMGDRTRKRIFSQEYEARVSALSQSKGQMSMLRNAIESAGLGEKIDVNNLSDSLKKVSTKDRSMLLAAIRQQEGGSDMAVGLAKEIGQILQLNVGTQGRSGGAVSAGALGMTGFLRAQRAMMSRFGLNDVRELNTNKKAAVVYRSFLEENMGYSGEQADAFIAAMEGMRGDFELLMKEGPATTDKQKAEQIKKYGAYLNEEGNLVGARLDKEGGVTNEVVLGKANFDAFVRTNEAVLTRAVAQKDENLELSKQIANNTVDIAQRIEMGVTYFLQGIYNLLDSIANFFFSEGLDKKGKESYRKVNAEFRNQKEDTRAFIEAEQKKLQNSNLSAEEKETAQKKIEGAQELLKTIENREKAFKDKVAGKDSAVVGALNKNKDLAQLAGNGRLQLMSLKNMEKILEEDKKRQEKKDKIDDYISHYTAKRRIEGQLNIDQERLKQVVTQNYDELLEKANTDPTWQSLDTLLKTKMGAPAQDFMYRGDSYGRGVVTPINTFDQAMGVMYGKPNGALDRAGRLGGFYGRSYSPNITINIMGDPMTIVRTVRKVLDAEKSRGFGGAGRTSSY